ncbi:MAG: Murein hydrolase activator EnvC [Candidatus Ordinivivax streblomastigis]|uniref:Murein hydrolase activator EnvC n=1 Tax=Candidatus Ordinivivax streblomastigis TaxID=2540710 RepID=A0A5M8NZI7_9BACT|nr:MAG: Murein hydrolase activator EnvC [Candidatus Ordinivivax streblomastigis]
MRTQWIAIACLFALAVSAQTPKTKELEKQRKLLLQEIDNTNQLITATNQSIKLRLDQLNLYAQQIQSRKKLVQVLEAEIQEIDRAIQLKEKQIEDKEQNLQTKKKQYVIAIQRMYKQKDHQDQLLFIFSAKNLSQSYRRMLYLREYSQWQRNQVHEITVVQQQLIADKKVLQTSKTDKENLAGQKKEEEERLQIEEHKKETQIADLQKNAKRLKAEMLSKQKQAAALNREIERIIQAEITKSATSAKKDKTVERKAETKGGFEMTKEERTLSSSFVGNKGKLPLPVKGSYRIVRRFGEQQYSELLDLRNTKITNNGIEIKTSPGNTAKAVFDGIITGIFAVPGFHWSVMVRHGNYITLYSYLDQVYVKEGAKVTTGQDVGKIYTDTENGNSTILHFELWKEKEKVNPEPWFNK